MGEALGGGVWSAAECSNLSPIRPSHDPGKQPEVRHLFITQNKTQISLKDTGGKKVPEELLKEL